MDALKYRHELKFVCMERDLCLIEKRIQNICHLDSHVGPNGTYVIRSLYFDTYDDKYYNENKMGIDERKKYRIRIYDGSSDIIKLECKHSLRGMKAKQVCSLAKIQFEEILSGKNISNIESNQKLLKQFVADKQMEMLVPKIIVEYTRTPYVYMIGNVRITLDRNIRSAMSVENFFDGNLLRRSIMPENKHVLEIKYDEAMPTTILELVTEGYNLRKTSFSKYMLCRDYNIR